MSLEEKYVKMIRCCGNCEYWQQDDKDSNSGECRRNPPSVYVDTDEDSETVDAAWPPTEAEEWCGEFKQREIQPLPAEKKGNGSVVKQE